MKNKLATWRRCVDFFSDAESLFGNGLSTPTQTGNQQPNYGYLDERFAGKAPCARNPYSSDENGRASQRCAQPPIGEVEC